MSIHGPRRLNTLPLYNPTQQCEKAGRTSRSLDFFGASAEGIEDLEQSWYQFSLFLLSTHSNLDLISWVLQKINGLQNHF